jgi:hypothetical protein
LTGTVASALPGSSASSNNLSQRPTTPKPVLDLLKSGINWAAQAKAGHTDPATSSTGEQQLQRGGGAALRLLDLSPALAGPDVLVAAETMVWQVLQDKVIESNLQQVAENSDQANELMSRLLDLSERGEDYLALFEARVRELQL